jgi:hypothetical protein
VRHSVFIRETAWYIDLILIISLCNESRSQCLPPFEFTQSVPNFFDSCCGINKMNFSYWEPPGVSERRQSVNLEASISIENQTLGGHSGRPSELQGSLMTGTGAPCKRLQEGWEHLGLSPNQCGNPKQTLTDAGVLWIFIRRTAGII